MAVPAAVIAIFSVPYPHYGYLLAAGFGLAAAGLAADGSGAKKAPLRIAATAALAAWMAGGAVVLNFRMDRHFKAQRAESLIEQVRKLLPEPGEGRTVVFVLASPDWRIEAFPSTELVLPLELFVGKGLHVRAVREEGFVPSSVPAGGVVYRLLFDSRENATVVPYGR